MVTFSKASLVSIEHPQRVAKLAFGKADDEASAEIADVDIDAGFFIAVGDKSGGDVAADQRCAAASYADGGHHFSPLRWTIQSWVESAGKMITRVVSSSFAASLRTR